MTEAELQNLIRIALSKAGVINFRNNTGMLYDKHGTPVRFGLCVGSSDIIGIKPVQITQEMVGDTVGMFVAVEVKTPRGKVSEAQRKFLDMVNDQGGLGYVARSVDEVV